MKQIKREWHKIDLQGKILGRISVEIAHLLMGKSKPTFARNLDIGDFVVCTNSDQISIRGNKEKNKEYIHHTGYPQGLRKQKFLEVKVKDSRKIISHAVSGMLPNNKLKPLMLKRLLIYKDSTHPLIHKFN